MMGDVTMSKMISVAPGFQYSVNIGYDLNNDNKLKNFIPTKSALALLEEILLSTNESSTERSRILIGAYGKGKSHIMLMILSMLLKKDLSLFEKTLPKIAENPKLLQLVENYYEGNNRILPVVITGSNTSLPCKELFPIITSWILCPKQITGQQFLLSKDGKMSFQRPTLNSRKA